MKTRLRMKYKSVKAEAKELIRVLKREIELDAIVF
jgi:hypothetical protein